MIACFTNSQNPKRFTQSLINHQNILLVTFYVDFQINCCINQILTKYFLVLVTEVQCKENMTMWNKVTTEHFRGKEE